MKREILAICLAAICVGLCACNNTEASTPSQTQTAQVGSDPTGSTAGTLPPGTVAPPATTVPPQTTEPTQPPQPTQPSVQAGWQERDGKTYFYLTDGTMATGWLEVEGKRYYFSADGVMRTEWMASEEGLYYLGEDGVMRTDWQEIGGKRYCFADNGLALVGWQVEENGAKRYFHPDGSLAVGWAIADGNRCYFDTEGFLQTGWVEDGGRRYYLDEDGVMYTGWLEQDGRRYYLRSNGVMARGCVEIEGVKCYFTSTGEYILLANPWNFIPEGYDPKLVDISDKYCFYGGEVAEECYEDLLKMLQDCEKQCYKAVVVSAYRTHEFQTRNYQRKVTYYKNQGYSQEEAEILAAKVVAVPGTSEHQLGLAVDLVDNRNWSLDDSQADTPVQKWLMEHCWEYGFILRYPKGTTDVTGIIYEPWHYRYVGRELAKELCELGITLEEYLNNLTEEEAALDG